MTRCFRVKEIFFSLACQTSVPVSSPFSLFFCGGSRILPEFTDFQIVQRGNGLQVLPGTTPVTFSMAHRHALLPLELEFIGIGMQS